MSETPDVFTLFLQMLPPDLFARLREVNQLKQQNNRVYNDAVVLWLMIVQRMVIHGTLETAVRDLLNTLPVEFWPKPCARLEELLNGGKVNLSSNTASYNEARQ